MLSRYNKLMIEKNYIKINKFIISKNWYELIGKQGPPTPAPG